MVAIYRSFQMPPESLNYLFALARTGYRSEFFSDFGKVTKISFQTLKNHNGIRNIYLNIFTLWPISLTPRVDSPPSVDSKKAKKNKKIKLHFFVIDV